MSCPGNGGAGGDTALLLARQRQSVAPLFSTIFTCEMPIMC